MRQSLFLDGLFQDTLHVVLASILAESLRRVGSQEHKTGLQYLHAVFQVFDVALHALNNIHAVFAGHLEIKDHQVDWPDHLVWGGVFGYRCLDELKRYVYGFLAIVAERALFCHAQFSDLVLDHVHHYWEVLSDNNIAFLELFGLLLLHVVLGYLALQRLFGPFDFLISAFLVIDPFLSFMIFLVFRLLEDFRQFGWIVLTSLVTSFLLFLAEEG